MSPARGRGFAVGGALAVSVSAAFATAIPATGASAPAASAARAQPICIAVVVDPRALGSPVSTGCAKVSPGSTGLAVLTAAGYRVGFRSDGLVCTIDGLPKSGCSAVDDSHFWAYYHRAPGATSWTYSTSGPATYKPPAGSTEGWVYEDGSSRTPEDVSYRSICPPQPHATSTPTPAATKSAVAHHRHEESPTTSAPSPSPDRAMSTPSAAGGRASRARHHRADRRARRHASAAAAAPTPAPTLSAGAAAADPPKSGGGSGPDDLIAGLVAVAVLGGLAVRRFRRPPRRSDVAGSGP